MKYARRYQVYADQLYLGDIINRPENKERFDGSITIDDNWYIPDYYRPFDSFGEAFEFFMYRQEMIDNTFEIRLVPVLELRQSDKDALTLAASDN